MAWIEVTEEQAAIIAKMARTRLQDLTMNPGLEYPGPRRISQQTHIENVEKEKTQLRAIGDKAVNTKYAQSMRHTVGADAMTPEAAQWLSEQMALLRDVRGNDFLNAVNLITDVLTPLGLTLMADTDATQYGVTCPPKPD